MTQKTTLVETKFLSVFNIIKNITSCLFCVNQLEIETSFQYKPQKVGLNGLNAFFLS